ncbi:copper oxidase [Pedobacter yulinensis]|uniref:Copper oxidase n=1 Tax=Pedobacter yulinensis TaxID=2126353 RepID=A0A2T3HKD7_9SPHI|nr:cytochrome c [Pedobacter yulinensis]PST82907.1 copper oxidase [Pedobacter yulinensis]
MRLRNLTLCIITVATILGMFLSCQSQEELDMRNYLSNGRSLYEVKCRNCHGEQGEGLGELAPPLTDSLSLKKKKKQLSCIIKNGLEGEIQVHGKVYNEKMPAFTELTDMEVAQLIVYITNSFGNSQGHYPYNRVTEDLKNCPSSAQL